MDFSERGLNIVMDLLSKGSEAGAIGCCYRVYTLYNAYLLRSGK